MDKLLRPSRFDCDPSFTGAEKEWKHWYKTFENCFSTVIDPDKLMLLTNYVSPAVRNIADSTTYETAIQLLKDLYVTRNNVIYARHVLATRKQQPHESLDAYVQVLNKISKTCEFAAVDAEKNRQDYVRDSFINGILSKEIRQRLLENTTLELKAAIDQARSLEMAQKNSEKYDSSDYTVLARTEILPENQETLAAATGNLRNYRKVTEKPFLNNYEKCFNCGNDRHPKYKCPAKNHVWENCNKRGHYEAVCMPKDQQQVKGKKFWSAALPILAVVEETAPSCLAKAVVKGMINKHAVNILIDSGILANSLNITITPSPGVVSMVSLSLSRKDEGNCYVDLQINNHEYKNIGNLL